MSDLYYLGIMIVAGLLLTRITKKLHLPNVTAYIIAGIIIGPYVTKLVSAEVVEVFDVITTVALGFIAFSIGDEFKISTLKAIGKTALLITLFEAVTAVVLVDIVTMLLGFPKPLCIMLGALAASTAPAATLLIVRQYKASGPLTNMLLPVVAADDAIGLMAYSISVSIAQGMVHHEAFHFVNTLLIPLGMIVLALVVGGILGLIVAISNRYFLSHGNRMTICMGAVLLGVAIGDRFGLSNLLICMAIGAVYANLRNDAERILGYIDDWTYPLFLVFFVVSGAELDVYALPKVGLLGLVYIIVRFAGKYLGSFTAAKICKCEPVVANNIGWALMPQAGVAIGMASLVVRQLPDFGPQIQTVILSATLVYEVLGPLAAKYALSKAGEIHAN